MKKWEETVTKTGGCVAGRALLADETQQVHAGIWSDKAEGSMAARVGRLDWASTPLGAIEAWPGELLVLVNLMLNSRQPTIIWWGREMVALYNDAYHETAANQRVVAGQAMRGGLEAVLPESVIAELECVLTRGEAILQSDVLIPTVVNGGVQERYWNYSMSPIHVGGEVAGVFHTACESTNAVLAMRALSESDERLRMALSVGNGVGLWELNFKNNLIYTDGKLPQYFDLEPAEGSEGSPLERTLRQVHPEDVERVRHSLNLSRDTGCPYSIHHRIVTADGSVRWVAGQAICHTDENGVSERLIGVVIDMSPRQLEEFELGQVGESYSREYVRSRLANLVKSRPKGEVSVVTAERVLGAVAIGFSDQRQLLYPAPVLRAMSAYGIELSFFSEAEN